VQGAVTAATATDGAKNSEWGDIVLNLVTISISIRLIVTLLYDEVIIFCCKTSGRKASLRLIKSQ
jgi:hypothetical protein